MFQEGEFDLDSGLDCLYFNLYNALEKFAPLKTVLPIKSSHPWYTAQLRGLISERDRLYKRYKRT